MNRKMIFLCIIIVSLPLLLCSCRKKIGIGSEDLFDTYYGLTRSEVKEIAPKYEPYDPDEIDGWAVIDEKNGFELLICISDYRVFGMAMFYDPRVKNKYQAEELMGIPSYAHCYVSSLTTSESLSCYRDF